MKLQNSRGPCHLSCCGGAAHLPRPTTPDPKSRGLTIIHGRGRLPLKILEGIGQPKVPAIIGRLSAAILKNHHLGMVKASKSLGCHIYNVHFLDLKNLRVCQQTPSSLKFAHTQRPTFTQASSKLAEGEHSRDATLEYTRETARDMALEAPGSRGSSSCAADASGQIPMMSHRGRSSGACGLGYTSCGVTMVSNGQ